MDRSVLHSSAELPRSFRSAFRRLVSPFEGADDVDLAVTFERLGQERREHGQIKKGFNKQEQKALLHQAELTEATLLELKQMQQMFPKVFDKTISERQMTARMELADILRKLKKNKLGDTFERDIDAFVRIMTSIEKLREEALEYTATHLAANDNPEERNARAEAYVKANIWLLNNPKHGNELREHLSIAVSNVVHTIDTRDSGAMSAYHDVVSGLQAGRFPFICNASVAEEIVLQERSWIARLPQTLNTSLAEDDIKSSAASFQTSVGRNDGIISERAPLLKKFGL